MCQLLDKHPKGVRQDALHPQYLKSNNYVSDWLKSSHSGEVAIGEYLCMVNRAHMVIKSGQLMVNMI